MQGNRRTKALFLAACVLLTASLACNLSNPQGPAESAPEVVTVLETATASQPSEATVEAPAQPAEPSDGSGAEGSSPEDSSNAGSGEGETTINANGDILTSVSIKGGNASFDGNVTYPGNASTNNITVKPIGLDSATTSGYLNFTLACSGRGKAKINYKGGAVKKGTPGCGETWSAYIINGSPDSHIEIRLDASGDIDWSLTVTGSEQ